MPKLTETMVSVEGEILRAVKWVIVEEVKSGDWGIDGKPFYVTDAKAIAPGKSSG